MAVNSKRTFKTKKTLSGVRTEFRAWKEWDEGDVLICKLIGTSQNRKNKSKKDWIVEVVEAFFTDKKAQKKFKEGVKMTLNCAGQLDKGMEQVEVGEMVQITYNGQQEMKGGAYAGEMAHLHEVVTVEEDDGSEDSEDEEDDEDLDEDEDEDEDEDSEEDEDEDDEDYDL